MDDVRDKPEWDVKVTTVSLYWTRDCPLEVEGVSGPVSLISTVYTVFARRRTDRRRFALKIDGPRDAILLNVMFCRSGLPPNSRTRRTKL